MSDEHAEATAPTSEPHPAAPDEHAHADAPADVPAEPDAPVAAEAEHAPAAPLSPAAADDDPFPVGLPAPAAVHHTEPKPKKPRAKKAAEPEEPTADAVDGDPTPAVAAVAAVEVSGGDSDPADADVPADAPAEPPPPENKKKWYAIKVQSGREDTIKAAILRKVAIEHLEDVFGQIMIPVEKVIEKRAVRVKDKKTGEYTTQEKKVEKKIKKFQGYIFAEMEFNDRMLYMIRETSGVGDFLKLRPRVNDTPVPEPMTDAEVKQMLGEKVGPETGKVVKLDIEKGDRIKIKEGPFKDAEAEVKDIQMPKDPTDPPKVIVVVTMWGRPLDVELDYWQVAKV